MVATIRPPHNKLHYENMSPQTHIHPHPSPATHSIQVNKQGPMTVGCGHGCIVTRSYIHPPTIHPVREVSDKAVPSSNQGRPGRAQEEGQSSKAATERGQPDEGNKVAAAEATLSRTHQEKNRTGQGKNGAPNPNCQALLSTLRICYVVLFVSVGV